MGASVLGIPPGHVQLVSSDSGSTNVEELIKGGNATLTVVVMSDDERLKRLKHVVWKLYNCDLGHLVQASIDGGLKLDCCYELCDAEDYQKQEPYDLYNEAIA